MAIDWSKAPCNATHGREHLGGVDFYHRDEAGTWNFWYVNRWEYAIGTSESSCVARPKSWNGEGLPPVGTACEWFDPGCERWLSVSIAYLSSWVIVLRDSTPHPDGSVEIAKEISSDPDINPKLRPIRTPEQIAADELQKMIADLADVIGSRNSTGDVLTAQRVHDYLSRIGYRKQEQP